MAKPAPPKDVMSVPLTPRARKIIEQLAEAYVTPKTKIAERALSWVAEQPEELQHIILTTLPESLLAVYAEMFERAAADLRAKASASLSLGQRITREGSLPDEIPGGSDAEMLLSREAGRKSSRKSKRTDAPPQ